MIINNTPGTLDVSHIFACFNKAVNVMLANFGNISSFVLCKIFNIDMFQSVWYIIM